MANREWFIVFYARQKSGELKVHRLFHRAQRANKKFWTHSPIIHLHQVNFKIENWNSDFVNWLMTKSNTLISTIVLDEAYFDMTSNYYDLKYSSTYSTCFYAISVFYM